LNRLMEKEVRPRIPGSKTKKITKGRCSLESTARGKERGPTGERIKRSSCPAGRITYHIQKGPIRKQGGGFRRRKKPPPGTLLTRKLFSPPLKDRKGEEKERATMLWKKQELPSECTGEKKKSHEGDGQVSAKER